jgi:hypothetical protein
VTLLERAMRPTVGASPVARAALERGHRTPRAKSKHIEMLPAPLPICMFGAGAAKMVARLETAALPRSGGFAA